MQTEDIEAYLAELGQELQDLGIESPVRVLLIDGAFMLLQVHNRLTTNDVDILFKDIADPATSPMYLLFKAAVQEVGRRHKIPATWLNDVMGEFLHTMGTVPTGRFWRRYTMLGATLYWSLKKIRAGAPDSQAEWDVHCDHSQLSLPLAGSRGENMPGPRFDLIY